MERHNLSYNGLQTGIPWYTNVYNNKAPMIGVASLLGLPWFPKFPTPIIPDSLDKWTGQGGSVATNSRQVTTFRTWESECVRSNNEPPVVKGLYHQSRVNLGIASSWVYHIINIPTIRSKFFWLWFKTFQNPGHYTRSLAASNIKKTDWQEISIKHLKKYPLVI